MAPLQDSVILAQYRSALLNWWYFGYVSCRRIAEEWIANNLRKHTPRTIAALMYQHVEAGGEIDQVLERRPEWNDRPFHYDLRLLINNRLIYIDTILVDDDPNDPVIEIVSIHHA